MRKLLILLLLAGCTTPKPDVIRDKTFDMDGGTFPFPIKVVIQEDPNKASKLINQYVEDSISADGFEEVAGYTFMDSEGRPVVIWLFQMSDDPSDVAVANHELLHATLAIMNFSGIPLTGESEEIYGYEMQHLSNQFYKQIKQ
jgi:hypothetical protein